MIIGGKEKFQDLKNHSDSSRIPKDQTECQEISWINCISNLGIYQRKQKSYARTKLRIIFSIVVIGIMITGCYEDYPELGDGYKIIGEGGYTTAVVDSQNTVMIPEYILDYAIDSTFILIAQSPPDSLPKMSFFYYSDKDRKKIAANNNVYRQYWIVNKKVKSIYSYDSVNKIAKYSNIFGPYTKEDYLKKKDSLNVSKDLKLESE